MEINSQSGNAVLWALMAIALFGALTAAIMTGSRSSIKIMSDEEAQAQAYASQEYTNTVNAALKRLKLRGCEDSEISYETPKGNNPNPLAPANEKCHVYRLNGGQVEFQGVDVAAAGKRVFVTSTTTEGNFGGLAGGDTICNNLAAVAGLGGTYMAWLSDSTASPDTRFTKSTDDYILVDDTVIANGWTDLIDADLDHAINLDENGNSLNTETFTGTIYNGTGHALHCNDWTTNALQAAVGGRNHMTNAGWTQSAADCGSPNNLYCFEQ